MRQMTVVVPTYNEADNLPLLAAALWDLPIPDLRILVIDDDSPDGTGRVADALSRTHPDRLSVVHRSGKRGLGSAYIEGFTTALVQGAESVAQMDADFSHSPSYLPGFLSALEDQDAVFGSRYVPGGSLDSRWGLGRRWLSSYGNLYARAILGLRVRDTTGGFRVWRRETLDGMPLDRVRSDGYVFQVEMALLAQRLGFRIREMPIHFEDRRIGQSKMSLRIQLEATWRVWQLRVLYRGLGPRDRRRPAGSAGA
jgi:dolichol-phosphate mannosyltransferase